MIDIGIVEAVNVIAGKTIVTVTLNVDIDKIQLGTNCINFTNQLHENNLSGHKWWPERRQIDLLFDFLVVPPQVGDFAFADTCS